MKFIAPPHFFFALLSKALLEIKKKICEKKFEFFFFQTQQIFIIHILPDVCVQGGEGFFLVCIKSVE